MAQGAATVKAVTSWGKNLKLQLLVASVSNATSNIREIALGNGDVADAAVGDTAMQAMIVDSGLNPAGATYSVANGVASWSNTWTASAAKTIKEIGVGIFKSSPYAPYIHITLGSSNWVTLAPGDSFQVTVTDAE